MASPDLLDMPTPHLELPTNVPSNVPANAPDEVPDEAPGEAPDEAPDEALPPANAPADEPPLFVPATNRDRVEAALIDFDADEEED